MFICFILKQLSTYFYIMIKLLPTIRYESYVFWRIVVYCFSVILTVDNNSKKSLKYTEEQLNTIDKSLVIHMLLAEQERTEELTNQVKELNAKLTEMDEKMQKLIEQVILSNRSRFGRSSEKIDD